SLAGIPTRVEPFFVVLDCGGVGYGVRIPGNVYEAIIAGGYDTNQKKFSLVTRSIYSEDNAQLFGFLTENEAQLFDFVRSLSGFGPQAAMGILSTLGADGLLDALLQQNVAALVKVPGVGKTKAEKLCFEANTKKAKLEKLLKAPNQPKRADDASDEILTQALLSLGYSTKEIQSASEKLKNKEKPATVTRENLQEWIRLFLQQL
ncbi:MAG TPA: Holliday junction ATP-dependent DNA helicase RuvA, partial [Turneriella sp.]|nr:Holliday junction ATP-dependent DNA helicase RuvA [Turneriella sp.]